MMTLPCGEFKMFQHVKTYLKLRAQTAAEIFKSSGKKNNLYQNCKRRSAGSYSTSISENI